MKAHKLTDGEETIARLRHLIVQRDLVERVASIGVSFEKNEDGNPTIVVAFPLLESEEHGNALEVLKMTEAIGIMFATRFEANLDEMRAHAIRAVVAAQWAVACEIVKLGTGIVMVDRRAGGLIMDLAALPCACDIVDGAA